MKPTHIITGVYQRRNKHLIGQEITLYGLMRVRAGLGHTFYIDGKLAKCKKNYRGLAVIAPEHIKPIEPLNKKKTQRIKQTAGDWDELDNIWNPLADTIEV